MADWNLPTLASLKSDLLNLIKGRDDDCATQFDSATSTATNVVTGTKRWNSTGSKWEKWDGSTWVDLTPSYGINVSYSANSGNAYTLGGKSLVQTGIGTQSTFADKIPYIGSDGGMEIGYYLDFHNNVSSDYAVRLRVEPIENILVIEGQLNVATTVNATTVAAPNINTTTVEATTVNATTVSAPEIYATNLHAPNINTTTVEATTVNATTVNATTVNAINVMSGTGIYVAPDLTSYTNYAAMNRTNGYVWYTIVVSGVNQGDSIFLYLLRGTDSYLVGIFQYNGSSEAFGTLTALIPPECGVYTVPYGSMSILNQYSVGGGLTAEPR